MPADRPPNPNPNPNQNRTQEQSIKARKSDLFEEEPVAALGSHRTFQELLRETPAQPLTPGLKALLWTVGVIVILLLIAAFATIGKKPKPKPQTSLDRVIRVQTA
jgi:hypothetical protein